MITVAKAGLEDVVVSTSEICFIDGHQGRLLYRGFDIDDLVAHSPSRRSPISSGMGRCPLRRSWTRTARPSRRLGSCLPG